MANTTRKSTTSWGFGLVFISLVVITIGMLVIQVDKFEAVAYPMHEFGKPVVVAATKNASGLHGLHKIGVGQLMGAEDIAYEPTSGLVYTGCGDGWIKRVTVKDSADDIVVENWVNTGGRPLGISVADSGDVFVADAFKYGRSLGSKRMKLVERTPLMIASVFGSKQVLNFILGLNGVDVNKCCGSDRATALHLVIVGGSSS